MSLAWNNNGVWPYKTNAGQSLPASSWSRTQFSRFFNRLLQLYIEKDTNAFQYLCSGFIPRLASLTRGPPQKRTFCEFFSVPGCLVEISSCAFEMGVPRSHLVNGILDLLPKPALSECCWLHCSVVKSLNTLPPLQKNLRLESSSGGKGASWAGEKFSFHIWEMLKVLFWWEWFSISSGTTFLMPNFTLARCKYLVNPILLLDLCSCHLLGGTRYYKTIHTDHLWLQFP